MKSAKCMKMPRIFWRDLILHIKMMGKSNIKALYMYCYLFPSPMWNWFFKTEEHHRFFLLTF